MSLYLYYGVMNSSKSNNLICANYEYRRANVKTLVLKPSIDTRSTKVESRVGISCDCTTFTKEDSIIERFFSYPIMPIDGKSEYKVVLVDEVQFITDKQAWELGYIANVLKIPVICYGLMLDFKGEVFEGTLGLIKQGAKLNEIKCCGVSRLTHHLRLVDGIPVFHGDTIQIGDEEYRSVDWSEFNGYK